jgi:hypothetical protein
MYTREGPLEGGGWEGGNRLPHASMVGGTEARAKRGKVSIWSICRAGITADLRATWDGQFMAPPIAVRAKGACSNHAVVVARGLLAISHVFGPGNRILNEFLAQPSSVVLTRSTHVLVPKQQDTQ